jgi:hypothetical protein
MDVGRGNEVADGIQVLEGEVRSLLIDPEAKKLSFGIAKLCLGDSKS